MLYPLIPARLHGWLDDLVVVTWIVGILVLELQGAALGLATFGAVVHFVNARITNYPQGTFRKISFRAHAWVEFTEGLLIAIGAWALVPPEPAAPRLFVAIMGLSQFGAFAFSDYRWPAPNPPAGAA